MNNRNTQAPDLPPEQIDKIGQWFDVMLYMLCLIGLIGWIFVGIREIFNK